MSLPKLINQLFRSIYMLEAIRLEAPISLEEAKVAVWAYGTEKALGPDRFTFKFIKQFWSLVSPDVMRFIRHFKDYGTLSRGCNSSFVTMASKTKDPASLNKFCPISLIGCLYKIISKFLYNSIKTIIGGVIRDV